jgi:hypothetical protein
MQERQSQGMQATNAIIDVGEKGQKEDEDDEEIV